MVRRAAWPLLALLIISCATANDFHQDIEIVGGPARITA